MIPPKPIPPTEFQMMSNSSLAVTYITPCDMSEHASINLKDLLRKQYRTNRVLIIYDQHVKNTQLIITQI